MKDYKYALQMYMIVLAAFKESNPLWSSAF